MAFIRKLKTKSGTYLAEVESVREGGKVRQRVIRYIGKDVNGSVVRKVATNQIGISEVRRHADVLVLKALSDELELDQVLGKRASEILLFVYAQILERKSIHKLEEWLSQSDVLETLQLEPLSTKELYMSLKLVEGVDFAVLQEHLNNKWRTLEAKPEAVVLDVTDTYFQGSQVDWKSRRGKDGVYGKLLQIAMGVSFSHGFPLSHKIYDGNVSNKRILRDMLSELVKMGYSSIILDRGMYSAANIERLNQANFTAIVGATKTTQVKRDFLLSIARDDIFTKNNQVVLKNTKVYVTSIPFLGGTLIAVFNPDAEVAQREEFLERKTGSLKEQFFGYSLVYHNTKHHDHEVIRQYFDKDIVERSFRCLKGPLSLRPIRVWLADHVQAHIKICYLAYALLALLQYRVRKLKLSAPNALDKLKTGYRVTLTDNHSNFSWSQTVTLSKAQDSILQAVGCSV